MSPLFTFHIVVWLIIDIKYSLLQFQWLTSSLRKNEPGVECHRRSTERSWKELDNATHGQLCDLSSSIILTSNIFCDKSHYLAGRSVEMWHPVTALCLENAALSVGNVRWGRRDHLLRCILKCVHLPTEQDWHSASWRYSKTASAPIYKPASQTLLTSLCKYVLLIAKDITSLIQLYLYREDTHSVRNNNAQHEQLLFY